MVSHRVKFELPQHVDDNMLPLYGGKLHIKSDNDEDLCIPYGGKFLSP